MRTIPEPMAADLAGGVTMHAHVWRVARRDGAVFAFTDHDQRLAFDDLICEPATGLGAGAMEKSLGLGPDSASVSGALSAGAITEQDLARGLWDGARVDVFRVDWRNTEHRVHLFAGRIGEVRRGAHGFEAELRGLQAPLSAAVGRVFSRFCDADVGDARCGVNLEGGAFRGDGVVAGIISSHAFRAAGLGSFAEGWFSRGRLRWSDGGESEVAVHRIDGAQTVLEVIEPLHALAPGAEFVITAGCDKRFATCAAKFANTANFRGFPHMPGNDAVQAGPQAGPLDGSSRFT